MREPKGEELLRRYRQTYGISETAPITVEMVRRHWDLERELARRIRQAPPEARWQLTDESYSTLYKELWWLNQHAEEIQERPAADLYRSWPDLIGPPPKSVYEVGSGKGVLLRWLAERGYRCKATEITRERGAKFVSEAGVEWGTTDGVHLDHFEPREAFDVVVSNQVIEHMHPDDVPTHFKAAWSILRAGGKYLLTTPHRHVGPADVSRVFGRSSPEGMHLKEYTYSEVIRLMKASGFVQVDAVFDVPRRAQRALHLRTTAKPSAAFLRYQRALESLMFLLPYQTWRTRCSRLLRFLLFRPSIFVIGVKA